VCALKPLLVLVAAMVTCSCSRGCDYKVAARAESPDGSLVALTVDGVCEGGLGGSTVIQEIEVAPNGAKADSRNVVFAVDIGGSVDAGPRVRWLSEKVLEISTPARSFDNFIKQSYEGVTIVHATRE